MNLFTTFKKEFTKLCGKWSIPTPTIEESFDFLNHVDGKSVTVYLDDSVNIEEAAAHVFGHYLAHLHMESDNLSDLVANTIASLVKESIAEA
tara:strand:- start:269 stop:544 length:276 start_codon:yes stop_codon:yes gene_type:complete